MSTFYKEFSVNPTSRELTDTSPAVAVVQHDANVDGILFHIPASFDSVDLTDSTTVLQVFYMLPGDDVTYVAPLTAYTPTSDMDASYKYYAWNFANSVLEKSGLISFSFCVQNATTNQDWNTRAAQLQIADTLDHTDSAISPGTGITSSIDAAIESAVSAYMASHSTSSSGSALTSDQQGWLITLLKKAVYTEDMSATVTKLEDSFSGIVHATGITLDKTTLSFVSLDTQMLTATLTPSGATDTVTWASSADSVATVSGGVVTPVSSGTAIITATANGHSATCTVTVAVGVVYKITSTLTNCTSSNTASSITSGSAYSTTITANSGYTLGTVSCTMGGVAQTVTDGAISIASVTGDIVITASAAKEQVLPTDSLMCAFDLRNKTWDSYNLSGWGTVGKIDSTDGKYLAFTDTPAVGTTGNDFGITKRIREIRAYTNESQSVTMPTAYTVFVLTYNGSGIFVKPFVSSLTSSNVDFGQYVYKLSYVNSSGTTVTTSGYTVNTKYKTDPHYTTWTYVVDGSTIKIYLDGTLATTFDGSALDSFDHWTNSPLGIWKTNNDRQMTFVLVYTRAMDETEIVDTTEYIKTMEVSA